MKTKLWITIMLFAFTNIDAQVPAYVPLNGLQGFWPFTGNANDAGGNGYNGTVNGATAVMDRFSSPNCAYSFNGSTDFISTNYQGILGISPRAVSFWAKTTITQPAMSCVAWGDNSPSTRFQCGFNYGVNGATINGSYGAITYTSPVSVSNGQWHHYVYQFSNSALNLVEIYQDGILLTQIGHSYSPTNILNTAAGFNVHFGKVVYAPSPDFFNGELDDFGIWDRTLTMCEINRLYTASMPAINVSASSATICPGQHVTLTAEGGTNYTWSNTSGGSSISVTPTLTTGYTVTGTTSVGCIATATISLTVKVCTAVDEISPESLFAIYPNPSNGRFFIKSVDAICDIEIFDLSGALIYSIRRSPGISEIELNDTCKGFYFIKFRDKMGQ